MARQPAPLAQDRQSHPNHASAPMIGEDHGRRALLVDGVVQSVLAEREAVGDYWHALLPDVRPERALLLGVGGGTLAAILDRRFPGVAMVGVDHDPRVVAIGRQAFHLALPNLSVVIADAFAFAAASPATFDYIAVDLFNGLARPREVLGRPFITDLRRLLSPSGTVAINLFRDRTLATAVTRIERRLSVRAVRQVGQNAVIHARRR